MIKLIKISTKIFMPAVFAVIIVIALAIKSFADTSIFGIHRDIVLWSLDGEVVVGVGADV